MVYGGIYGSIDKETADKKYNGLILRFSALKRNFVNHLTGKKIKGK